MVKQRKIKKFLGSPLGFITMLFLVVIITGITHQATKNMKWRINVDCNKYPDKCVCEEYIKQSKGWIDKSFAEERMVNIDKGCKLVKNKNGDYNIICLTDKCNKYHRKTQSELDIDDCSNNSREDDKCRCEEYFDDIVRDVSLNDCLAGKIKDIRCVRSGSGEYINYSIYPNCKKSYPKTECEKGNIGWVEEGKDIIINTSEVGHRECILKSGWFCPFTDGLKLVDSKNGYVQCVFKSKVCVATTSICREKTEVEKLMEKDCEFIQSELFKYRPRIFSDCPDNPPRLDKISWLKECDYLKGLLIAWRQKECEI